METPPPRPPGRPDRPPTGRRWLLPAALLLLGAVPSVAGVARLAGLASGAPATADSARFVEAPLPVVVHVVGATLFVWLGAFQLVPGLRRRRLRWHRAVGRVVVPAGLVAAASGLWMSLVDGAAPQDGPLLAVLRVVFGVGMAAALVLGVGAAVRHDLAAHRAWMARGYAIGLGAGTQVFTLVPYLLVVGEPGRVAFALLMAAGWVINLAVVETVLRRRPLRALAPAVRRPPEAPWPRAAAAGACRPTPGTAP